MCIVISRLKVMCVYCVSSYCFILSVSGRFSKEFRVPLIMACTAGIFFFWESGPRGTLIAAAVMKAIGKLREEGQTRYFFLISLSSSPILFRQPLPWNHFVDWPQLLISFNVQVVRTAKYAYFASYLDYKLIRLLSYFSWNIHSIYLTPVNENLFRHWFSVAIIRGRSRTVYQSGREKRRDESFQVRARSENRYVF